MIYALLGKSCCFLTRHFSNFFESVKQTETDIFLQADYFLGRLAWAGLFKDGKSYGASWRGLDGGGFLYGSVSPNGRFTGLKNAYIYPGNFNRYIYTTFFT